MQDRESLSDRMRRTPPRPSAPDGTGPDPPPKPRPWSGPTCPRCGRPVCRMTDGVGGAVYHFAIIPSVRGVWVSVPHRCLPYITRGETYVPIGN